MVNKRNPACFRVNKGTLLDKTLLGAGPELLKTFSEDLSTNASPAYLILCLQNQLP